MTTYRTVIVDDDPGIRKGIEAILRIDPEIDVIAHCGDGRSAVNHIRELRPELVFLDVQMPELDAFEVIAELNQAERPQVILITAHERHAVKAFELSVADFLLKPFTSERLIGAIKKAKDAILRERAGGLAKQVEQLLQTVRVLENISPAGQTRIATDRRDQLVLKVDGVLHFIKTADVLWIEAQGDFVKVQTREEAKLVRDTLQHIEQRLDGSRFLRTHRSFLVNLEHVSRVETALYGDYTVHMNDGTKLRLSRSYRTKLKQLLESAPVA